MSPKNRERLRKKLKYYSDWLQVGGYITPAEFVYMIEKFSIDNHRWERYLRDKKNEGDSTPTWVYFSLTQQDLERV